MTHKLGENAVFRTVVCHLIVGRFFVCFAIEFIEFTCRQYAVIFFEELDIIRAAQLFNANDKLCNLPQEKASGKERNFYCNIIEFGIFVCGSFDIE